MSRITVEDLKGHTGVTDKQLGLQCSDQHLDQLAHKVPNWLSLAMTLDLGENQQQAIRVDQQLDYLHKTMAVLKIWKRNNGKAATYLRLVRGCLELNNALLAGEVCTLAKSASRPHSLDGWFTEIGLMEKDIDILNDSGYGTKQAFQLLALAELNNLGLTRAGIRLLEPHVRANQEMISSSSTSESQAATPDTTPATKYLDTNTHLKHVFSHTFEARIKWFNIGLQLGVEKHVLDGIKRNRDLYDDGDYYREVLTSWIQAGSATIEELLEVLEGPTVAMTDVARKVKELSSDKKRQIGF